MASWDMIQLQLLLVAKIQVKYKFNETSGGYKQ